MNQRKYSYYTVKGIVLVSDKSGVILSLDHGKIGYLPYAELKIVWC